MRKFISVLLVVVLVLAATSMAFAVVSPSQYTGGGGSYVPPADRADQNLSDGTTVTTETSTDANGSTITEITATTPDGTVTKTEEVVLSDQAVAAATDGTVTAPVSVTATDSFSTAPTVKVTYPSGANVSSIEIPVTNATDNTVAYLVNADGTTTLIKETLLTDNGIVIPAVSDPVTVKIVNNDKTFGDENQVSSWARDGKDFVTARDLFIGDENGMLNPKDSMSVGEATTMLSRMGNKNLNTTGSKWYVEPMSWASGQGMNPQGVAYDTNISRQLFGHMLWILSGSPTSTATLDGYADAASVDPTFVPGLAWAVESGIIQGDGTSLNPNGDAKREEIMEMDKRYYENK